MNPHSISKLLARKASFQTRGFNLVEQRLFFLSSHGYSIHYMYYEYYNC